MDIEYLLTATRSARKTLDLDAPVDLDDIRECLRIGLQAANGSNQQSWRWLVVADPALRERDRRAVPRGLPAAGRRPADRRPAAGRHAGRPAHVFDGVVGREHGEGAAAGDPLLSSPTCRASTATSRFTWQRCTARSSRRSGTSSWRCTPADTGPASRPCTCTTKTRCGSCSGSRRPTSRVVCCRWAGFVPGTRSGPPVGGPSSEVVALRRLGRARALTLEWVRHRCYAAHLSRFAPGHLIAFNKDLVRQEGRMRMFARPQSSRCARR